MRPLLVVATGMVVLSFSTDLGIVESSPETAGLHPALDSYLDSKSLGIAFESLAPAKVEPQPFDLSGLTVAPSKWNALASELEDHLKQMYGAKVAVGDRGLEIILESDSIFSPGTAEISEDLEPDLIQLATLISEKATDLGMAIESHTDDTPIVKHRREFPSNWQLSTARAGTLAHFFETAKFPGQHLQAVGFGDSRPLGEDKAQNRRVVIRLSELAVGG